ncbi:MULTISPECIES: enoyl-CoA hydratase/isomerase family protein [unclassified Novosphingobium]|uniref:enoyl-CoA hydratase/isomerase family protein n=1 Tax=unclassified Novosphingobium TaxID=2644732 RepID=UPI00146AEF39|nr:MULTISPECIES: enoyl-CoA hydratase/isomerase family protein [unclassified Novosphingobium]NMN03116.1 enoyl-CoA hydratase [Novosphingobium sp. SG919]NMN86896.1 enoyl-CoA hydratase [Novosphingobium sp. SG916]
MTPDVIVRREGCAGILSLNRPRAIHALTLPMVKAMTDALLAWQDDPAITAVIIDHAPAPDGDPKLSRGFCAGGDIALLRGSALEDGGARAREFFFHEYRLNHLLFTYVKPVVAFMDGITMGGGVGISQPARWRVATAKTRLAMPETGIGLFPDVGGGWYLSRLKGRLGQYLALTGARLDGAECLWAGLATHYLEEPALAQAKARIAAGENVGEALDALAGTPGPAPIAAQATAIARHFLANSLPEILASLARDPAPFAQETLATLATRSPFSCAVSLRQLAQSLALPDFAANMAMEYRVGGRMIMRPDFAEGVRAVIVDKDNAPRWNPASPEGVAAPALDAIFAPLPQQEEWTPL